MLLLLKVIAVPLILAGAVGLFRAARRAQRERPASRYARLHLVLGAPPKLEYSDRAGFFPPARKWWRLR